MPGHKYVAFSVLSGKVLELSLICVPKPNIVLRVVSLSLFISCHSLKSLKLRSWLPEPTEQPTFALIITSRALKIVSESYNFLIIWNVGKNTDPLRMEVLQKM